MKPNRFNSFLRSYVLGLSAAVGVSAASQAATINKANNTDNLNTTTSWSGAVVPGAADIGTWTSTVGSANSTILGADLAWQGLAVTNPGGSVSIGTGNTLTLGSSGIDLSNATQSLTIGSGLALAPGGQTWNVATGQSLTLTGALTRPVGAAFGIDKSVNTGSVIANPTLVNGIVGPWASIRSAGTSAGASADGDTYATVATGSLVPYTAATQLTTTGAWGGMPGGGTATVNYDHTASANPYGSFGVARFANTVRYTGPGVARQPGNTDNADLFTMNGFMNAGGGTFTFGTAGNVANDRPYNVLVGPNLDMVLSPMTAGITFLNPIKNNPAGASAITIAGRETVTLSGVSAYTGATTVAGGTLLVNGSGSINASSSLAIRGANAKYLHTSSVASTVPINLTRGTLDGTGSVGAVTVGSGTGGVINHGNGGASPLTMGSLAFNGAATVNASYNGSAPFVVSGALTTTPANGKVTINASAGLWSLGSNDVISTGNIGSVLASDFQVGTVTGLNSRQSLGGVVLNGNNVAIQINGDAPVWTGANSGNWTTNTIASPKNWKLLTAGTGTDFLTGDIVLFNDNASVVNTNINVLNDDVSPASTTFNNSSKNYTLGSLNTWGIATGSLTKSGTGSLTISKGIFNLYNGGTTFTGGTLNLNDDTALGLGPVTIATGNPKILNNTSGAEVALTSTTQSWNDDFTFTGTNNLDMGTGTVTLGGAGTDRSVTVNAGILRAGELKGAAHGFVKQGPGTLRVASIGNGAAGSQITGALNVAAGTLQINQSEVGAGASGDFVATGLSGSGTVVNGAAAERWLFVNTATDQTFPGTLANGGSAGLGFNKQGAGIMTLEGTNSYTGQTTLEGGTLVAANPAALGNTSLLRFSNNTTFRFATDGGDNLWPIAFGSGTTANIVSGRATPGAGINHNLTTQTGNNGLGGGAINVTSGPNVTSGEGRITFNQFGLGAGTVQTTTLNPTTANVTIGDVGKQNGGDVSQTLGLGGTSTDNLATGVISNGPALTTGVVSVLKTGASTWTLSNTNTYTGDTTLGVGGAAAGVLRVTASGALGSGTLVFDTFGNSSNAQLALSGGISIANNVTFTPRNVATPAILNEAGNNILSGNFSIATGGAQNRFQSDAGTLSVTGGITTVAGSPRNVYFQGASDGLMSGVISNNAGNAAGKINLIKEGNGTWTLSGVNTTDGTTTISAGTLAITGSSATSAVTVAPTATLGGNGNLGGSVTINAGAHHALAVAATPGTQVTRNIGGVLDLTAVGDILDLTAAAAPAAGSYTLVTASGGITGHTTGTLDDTVINQTGVSGTVAVVGNDLVLTVGGASPYNSWADMFGLNPATTGAAGVDFEKDGFENGTEFILGGSPISGSNNPKIYSLLADSSADVETTLKELVLTIAVPVGTPTFSAGSPTSSASFQGFGITVRGSTTLSSFPVVVTPVDPVTTGLPAAPVQGGITYEYRSFSLNGSNGLGGKGFFQVEVTNP